MLLSVVILNHSTLAQAIKPQRHRDTEKIKHKKCKSELHISFCFCPGSLRCLCGDCLSLIKGQHINGNHYGRSISLYNRPLGQGLFLDN
jgi:hypothetical protein